ncbi:MAG: hypothetical protein JKY44_05805, partial [Flavobacteriaceae bacterium]|nr:hypothetical protein [Flavobacteriaceae bacterium]
MFFTYNSKYFEKTQVDINLLKGISLKKTLQLLEKDTSFYFDDLGNNYYVIYIKTPSVKKPRSIVLTTNSLQKGIQLDEVVITGNRTKPRTVLDSPIPIDNID